MGYLFEFGRVFWNSDLAHQCHHPRNIIRTLVLRNKISVCSSQVQVADINLKWANKMIKRDNDSSFSMLLVIGEIYDGNSKVILVKFQNKQILN